MLYSADSHIEYYLVSTNLFPGVYHNIKCYVLLLLNGFELRKRPEFAHTHITWGGGKYVINVHYGSMFELGGIFTIVYIKNNETSMAGGGYWILDLVSTGRFKLVVQMHSIGEFSARFWCKNHKEQIQIQGHCWGSLSLQGSTRVLGDPQIRRE